jgi:hypothetical protein
MNLGVDYFGVDPFSRKNLTDDRRINRCVISGVSVIGLIGDWRRTGGIVKDTTPDIRRAVA